MPVCGGEFGEAGAGRENGGGKFPCKRSVFAGPPPDATIKGAFISKSSCTLHFKTSRRTGKEEDVEECEEDEEKDYERTRWRRQTHRGRG